MNCPLCNGDSFTRWGAVGSYAIVRCAACGLGITSPFPEEQELNKSNQEIYQLDQRRAIYLSQQKYFEKRYGDQIDRIKQFKKNGALLDIGCNIGLFLKVARETGYTVTGVELNRQCADYGKTHFHLDIRTDDLHRAAFASNSFDVVTLFDVLEHIPDLHRFLSEVKRILKKDGLMVIQSPNIDSLMAKLTASRWNWLTPPDHVYHFTPRTLASLLAMHGFKTQMLLTWEPAREFSNNLLSASGMPALFRKALILMNQITGLFTLPVLAFHHLWWRKQRGGLIELYALKIEERENHV